MTLSLVLLKMLLVTFSFVLLLFLLLLLLLLFLLLLLLLLLTYLLLLLYFTEFCPNQIFICRSYETAKYPLIFSPHLATGPVPANLPVSVLSVCQTFLSSST